MVQEFEVRQKMADAINMSISVLDFIRWVMSNSWNMHRDSSRDAVDLVSQIHLLMAERDDFLLSDPAFLDELSKLNRAINIITLDIEQAEGESAYQRVVVLNDGSASPVKVYLVPNPASFVPLASPDLVHTTRL